MGLGSTARKLQTLGDKAEELYARVGELKEQLQDLKATVETTGRKVDRLENRVARQDALLEAIATEHDVDVESVLAEEVIEDAEAEDAPAEGDGTAAATEDD
jgi:septal ring factor EnvC (AmiA/AmiB activator)